MDPGKRADPDDLSRDLVSCQAFAAESEDLVIAGLPSLTDDDRRCRYLPLLSSGIPKMATSTTAGCCRMTFSTSVG